MAVRPQYKGWLTLINRETNEAIRLADVLFDEEKLYIYKSTDFGSSDFHQWDGLEVIGREGNKLKLNYIFICKR